jgi:hypothetical protein
MDGYWTQAVFDGFNTLFAALSTPSYGTYVTCNRAPVPGEATTSMYTLVSYDVDADLNDVFGPAQPGQTSACDRETNVSVFPGDGRRVFTRYDYESGYYLFDKVLETGSFWDYLAAFTALTTTTANRLGVEFASDQRSFLIPWYKVFEKEMNLLANGIFSENYESYAPRLVAKDGNVAELRPFRPVTFLGSPDANAGTPINLNINFTQQIYALLFPMSLFQSDYSLHYQDNAHIFQMGSAGQSIPNVDDGFEILSFTDPANGVTYGAIAKIGATDAELTLAARMIKRGQALVAGGSGQLNNLAQHIEFVNLMRSFYDIFGRNF